MKFVMMTLMTALISTSAMAADKMVCREYSGQTMTVVITPGKVLPVGKHEMLDEKVEGFMEIYTKDATVPSMSIDGIIEAEDVSYDFKSKDKKIKFSSYMDDMTQTTLTINGKNYDLVCY